MVQKKKQFKKTLYNSFINNFILEGKKKTAKGIVDTALLTLSTGSNLSLVQLLFKVYFNIDYFIEIKQVVIKRRTYTVPFSIIYNRRIYLIIKKIKNAINLDKRKISLPEKLKFELYNILNLSSSSRALKMVKKNQSLVRSSRSNIHFRWK
jgi:ribosomal protein S7